MEGGGTQYNNLRTVEEVFRDFKGRRVAVLRALTTDVQEFFQQCDPVVTGTAKGQTKERPSSENQNGNRSKSNSKERGLDSKISKTIKAMEEEEEEEEHGETLCGACGDNYASDEFWICCDMCETWFHGTCVKITPARAEHIKHYKCPSCSNKRALPY